MGFGSTGRQINTSNANKAPEGTASFEELAEKLAADYQEEPKKEDTVKEEKKVEIKAVNEEEDTVTEEVEEIIVKPQTRKTSTSKKKAEPKKYYKQFYNLRIDLPKESEPLIELAAKKYGSRKDYVTRLIIEDMKLHAEEYRAYERESKNLDWNF